MYEVGDMVCYPMHGAGIIVDIEKKNILGKNEEYFVVKIPSFWAPRRKAKRNRTSWQRSCPASIHSLPSETIGRGVC